MKANLIIFKIDSSLKMKKNNSELIWKPLSIKMSISSKTFSMLLKANDLKDRIVLAIGYECNDLASYAARCSKLVQPKYMFAQGIW